MSIVQRLCAALAVTGLLLSTLLVAGPAVSAAGGSAAYDRSLNVSNCDLLGRVYVKGSGCARKKCVQGAKLWRKVYGAEACQLRNQGDYGFVSTVDFRRCAALGRRWISQVNFCASYPDRSATAVYDAPQCTGARSVYVTNTEADGFYDECLTPDRVRELVGIARSSGSDLTAEASLRSSVQCGYRPASSVRRRQVRLRSRLGPRQGRHPHGRRLADLARHRRAGPAPAGGSRSTASPPGRSASCRAGLSYYVSGAGQPTGLIVALGAVPPPAGYGKSDLARTIKSVPRSTKVMFVMPYAALPSGNTSPRTTKIGSWMRAIAKSRGRACVADWPSFVRSRHGLIQDGVHVKNSQERTWAKFISQQWGRC